MQQFYGIFIIVNVVYVSIVWFGLCYFCIKWQPCVSFRDHLQKAAHVCELKQDWYICRHAHFSAPSLWSSQHTAEQLLVWWKDWITATENMSAFCEWCSLLLGQSVRELSPCCYLLCWKGITSEKPTLTVEKCIKWMWFTDYRKTYTRSGRKCTSYTRGYTTGFFPPLLSDKTQ